MTNEQSYLTYQQWKKIKVAEIAEENHCSKKDAEQCVDNWRWWKDHVQPLMNSGVQPTKSVCRSLAEHSPYSLVQICKMFYSLHGREFLPPYVGYDGKTIKDTA